MVHSPWAFVPSAVAGNTEIAATPDIRTAEQAAFGSCFGWTTNHSRLRASFADDHSRTRRMEFERIAAT